MLNKKNCPLRHQNGNCLAVGGFCTAVSDEICYGLLNAYDHGKNDVLELLKWQEPRVIAREELKQFEDSPCWFESHDTYMGKEGFWIIPYMFTCYQTMYYVYPLLSANERGNMHYSELGLSAYNKTWRCWSAKPTDEQRKAVKWNG